MKPKNDRYNLKIEDFERYDFNSFKSAIETFIYTSSRIESPQLVEELKIKHATDGLIVAEAKSFNYLDNTLNIRSIYETKNVNLNNYKVKIIAVGQTINGKIYIERIRKLILIK